MKILFPVFVIATLIEIYTIIQVGEVIGGFNTILLIILTAAIGSFLLKQQGLAVLQQSQMQMSRGQLPAQSMLEGVVIIISGVLLLTPGFITDFIGLLGLLPFSRVWIINKFIVSNQSSTLFRGNQQRKKVDDNVIDGEFWD